MPAIPPLGNNDVLVDAKAYRKAVTKYANDLRAAMNLSNNADFDHMIRIRYKGAPIPGVLSADCGCGCS
jgi:hypothetical protein